MAGTILMLIFCVVMLFIACYYFDKNEKLLLKVELVKLENKNLNLFIESFIQKGDIGE
jgi:hypothetical protein